MRLTVSEEVVVRDLGGEAILLDMATSTYFGLNAVGTRIWNLLVEHQRTDRIVPLLLEEFDVAEDALRLDVDRLVTQLLEKGLLIEADDPI